MIKGIIQKETDRPDTSWFGHGVDLAIAWIDANAGATGPLIDWLPKVTMGQIDDNAKIANRLVYADTIVGFFRGYMGDGCCSHLFSDPCEYHKLLKLMVPAAFLPNELHAPILLNCTKDFPVVIKGVREFMANFVANGTAAISSYNFGLCTNATMNKASGRHGVALVLGWLMLSLGFDIKGSVPGYPVWVDRTLTSSHDYSKSQLSGMYCGPYLEARIELAKRCIALIDTLTGGVYVD